MCDDHYQVNSLRKYLRKLKLYIMKRNIKATKKGLSDSLYTKALIRKCLRNLQDYLLKVNNIYIYIYIYRTKLRKSN